MNFYPLLFKPRFVEKMWGGRKLQTLLDKALPSNKPFGESWEIYDFPPGIVDKTNNWVSAEVANGNLAGTTLHTLMTDRRADLLGNVKPSGPHDQFPLLIKYLDAREDLSVQVHPDQAYTAANPGAHLKSESWYVVQHEPGSRILKGLMFGVDQAGFAESVKTGNVEQAIRSIEVEAGHSHYLPSGTVHALGAGILAAEVQTPSDTTFRVYDFDRVDPTTGKLRDLHVEQAMACIDFENEPPAAVTDHSPQLVRNEFFHVDRVTRKVGETIDIMPGRPAIWMIVSGSLSVELAGEADRYVFGKGHTVLLPASMSQATATISQDATFLSVTFP